MLNIRKTYLICIVIYHFYLRVKRKEKCNKLVYSMHDKKNYVVHIKALKQALSHGLIL